MEPRQQAEQDALKMLNNVFGDIMGFSRRASYRYYAPKSPANEIRANDKYFHTTGKELYLGKERYISGVYRYKKSDRKWVATKKAGHAKKKDAIARAYKLSKENA